MITNNFINKKLIQITAAVSFAALLIAVLIITMPRAEVSNPSATAAAANTNANATAAESDDKKAATFNETATALPGSGAGAGIKIIDMASREVIIDKIPEKILSVNSASRFITYLGADDKLCGIENIDKNFINTRAYTIARRAEFEKLEVIGEGGYNKPLNLEKIISLKPELIFEAFCDREAADLLQKQCGVKVISLSYGEKSWFDEKIFFATLNIAAGALGCETRAAELINFVGSLNDDLAKRSAAGPGAKNPQAAPRCYIGAVAFRGRQGITSTDSMYPPFIKTGAANVVSESSPANSHIFLDLEKLLVYDPEFIFIDAAGLATINEDYIKNKEFYKRLAAVKNKKVFLCLPSVFYHLNIETLYINSYFIGKIINPAAFEDIDPAAKADEIFEKFCGRKCYETLNKEYGAFSRLEFGENAIEIIKL